MVIGNGMIANAFKQYADDDRVIIFASGVSNSKETNEEAFAREIDLLKSMRRDVCLVYFSTCSMYDLSVQDTKYVNHKWLMEGLVKSLFNKSIIFRLPTLVGNTKNPHTFFNFFKNKITSGSELTIPIGSKRYLIGVEDLKNTLSPMIDKYKIKKESFNIKTNAAFSNDIEVVHIATMMMQIIGRVSPILFEDSRVCGIDNDGFAQSYKINNSDFEKHLKEINYKLPENYTYNLLKKYLLEHE
jgi:hypothetical protein